MRNQLKSVKQNKKDFYLYGKATHSFGRRNIVCTRKKDNYLEIQLSDRNWVDDKIAWGLDGGLLSFHSSFVC